MKYKLVEIVEFNRSIQLNPFERSLKQGEKCYRLGLDEVKVFDNDLSNTIIYEKLYKEENTCYIDFSKKFKNPLIQKDTLIYAKNINGIPKCKYVNWEDDLIGNVVYKESTTSLIPRSEIIRPKYLYYLLNSDKYSSLIYELSSLAYASHMIFSKKILENMEVDIPTIEEQDKALEYIIKATNIIVGRLTND